MLQTLTTIGLVQAARLHKTKSDHVLTALNTQQTDSTGGGDAGVCVSGTAVDSFGDGCSWYDGNPDGCGHYDTFEFSASSECCACGGGLGSAPSDA